MKKIQQFMKLLGLTMALAMLFPVALFSQCSPVVVTDSQPFAHGFEGSTPFDCWTQDTLSGGTFWRTVTGANAYNGQSVHYTGPDGYSKTQLISPVLDVSQLSSRPKLSFWHWNTTSQNLFIFGGGTGTITVYFRESPTSQMTQLAVFNTVTSGYVKDSVVIPSNSNTLQIIIEGAIVGGLGNISSTTRLDDILLEGSGEGGQSLGDCPAIDITMQTPYTEDFSGANGVDSLQLLGELPTCWNGIYTGVTAHYNPKVYNGADAITAGDNALAITSGTQSTIGFASITAGTNNYAILPEFSNDLETLELFFTYKMTSSSSDTLTLGYLTDYQYGSDFTPLTRIAKSTTARTYHVNLVDFPQLVGQTVRLALRYKNDNENDLGIVTSATTCYIDDVIVRIVNPCAEVSNIAVSNITDVSALVTWSAEAGQTTWQVLVNGNVAGTATDTTFTLTGLTGDTPYSVNVRALCGDTDTAYLSQQPANFQTLCATIVVDDTHPYAESYESIDLGCWIPELISGNDAMQISREAAYDGAQSAGLSSTIFGDLTDLINVQSIISNMANLSNSSAALVSPIFDLTGFSGAASLTFYRYQPSQVIAQNLELFYRTSPSSAWTSLGNFHATTNFVPEAIVLPNPSATYQLRFVATFDIEDMQPLDITQFSNLTATATLMSDFFIDDVRISLLDICDEPTDLSVGQISYDSATVTWTGSAENSNWTIEYGVAGFTQGSGTSTNVSTPTFTMSGLTGNTTYDVYVRGNCVLPNVSEWVQTSFTTTAPPPCEEPTNLTVSQIGETGATVTWTPGGRNTRWTIEYGVQGFTPGTGTIRTITTPNFTITGLTASTSYDFYVSGYCDVQDESNFVMTNFTTAAPPPCEAPTNLNVAQITETSATVRWTSGGQNTNWTLEYGVQGFTLGTGTTATTPTPNYTITGLTPNTAYDVYVHGHCRITEISDNAQTNFTTAEETVTPIDTTEPVDPIDPIDPVDPTAIADFASTDITIAPNPTNGTIFCHVSSDFIGGQLHIYNMYGELLLVKPINAENLRVDMSPMAAGIYFVRIAQGNEFSITKKIIRN